MSRPEERSGVTSPPSGNGSVPGLGEAFSINLGTGQGVYSYKLPLPAGRAGHGARLGARVPPRRRAWCLRPRLAPAAARHRAPAGLRRPRQPGSSERWLDGGEELVETPDGSYAAAREGAFTRYERHGDGWLVEDRNGIVHECGLAREGRVADPDHPDRVQEWLIERSLDPSGNAVEYAYEHEDGVAYPAAVKLGRVRAALRLRAAPGRAGGRARRIRAHDRAALPRARAAPRSWHGGRTARALLGVRLSRGAGLRGVAAGVGHDDVARRRRRRLAGRPPRAGHVRLLELRPARGARAVHGGARRRRPAVARHGGHRAGDARRRAAPGHPPGRERQPGLLAERRPGALGRPAAGGRDPGDRLLRRQRDAVPRPHRLRAGGHAGRRRPAPARLLRERRRRRLVAVRAVPGRAPRGAAVGLRHGPPDRLRRQRRDRRDRQRPRRVHALAQRRRRRLVGASESPDRRSRRAGGRRLRRSARPPRRSERRRVRRPGADPLGPGRVLARPRRRALRRARRDGRQPVPARASRPIPRACCCSTSTATAAPTSSQSPRTVSRSR